MLNRRKAFPLILAALLIPLAFLTGCDRQTGADTGGAGPRDVKVEEIHSDGAVQVEHPEQFLLATVEQRPTCG